MLPKVGALILLVINSLSLKRKRFLSLALDSSGYTIEISPCFTKKRSSETRLYFFKEKSF